MSPFRQRDLNTQEERTRHNPEQIVKKLRDADAMLNSDKELAVVLQTLEISEVTYHIVCELSTVV